MWGGVERAREGYVKTSQKYMLCSVHRCQRTNVFVFGNPIRIVYTARTHSEYLPIVVTFTIRTLYIHPKGLPTPAVR